MREIEVIQSNDSCRIYVNGFDMNCPVCGVLVPSGTLHECGPDYVKPAKKGTKQCATSSRK